MKKFLFIALSLCTGLVYADTLPIEEDSIEKAINTLDVTLSKQTLASHPMISPIKKIKYLDCINDKIYEIRREVEFEELGLKVGNKLPFHSGKSVLGFFGLLCTPLVIIYYCVLNDLPYRYTIPVTALWAYGTLYCLCKGEEEEQEFRKNREQNYKKALDIKYILLEEFSS